MSDESIDYESLTLVEASASYFHRPTGNEDVYQALRGAVIVNIGAPAEDGIEGGGLIIDYIPRGETDKKRVVFAFTELGMWVEYFNGTQIS